MKKFLVTFDKDYRDQSYLIDLANKRINEFQLENYSEPVSDKIERIKDISSHFYIKVGDYNNG